MEYIKVNCQEKICPYGKQPGQRCFLCEVAEEDIANGPIHQRHKCPKAKKGGLTQIVVTVGAA